MNDNSEILNELIKEQKEQTKYLKGIYQIQLFLFFLFAVSLLLMNGAYL